MDPIPAPATALSRRHFLGLTGAGLFHLSLSRLHAAEKEDPLARRMLGQRYNDPLQPLTFQVTRAWDMLNFELELVNFMPVRQYGYSGNAPESGNNGKRNPLMPGNNEFKDRFYFHIASYSRPGYVIIRLGGQHLAEQALWDRPILPEGQSQEEDRKLRKAATFILNYNPKKPVIGDDDIHFLRTGRFGPKSKKLLPGMPGGLAGAWLAGHSQLVFEIPQRYTPLEFDLENILETALTRGILRVHPRLMENKPPATAFTGSADPVLRMEAPYLGQHDTGAPYTRLEFPSMLYISPYDNARWHLRPKSWGLRSELWSLDLQRPDRTEDTAGRPRDLRRQGHLFAYDTEGRPARWPQEEHPAANDKRKYADKETPKTSLYKATRELLVRQMSDDNGDILAEDFRLTTLGATAHLQYRPIITPRLRTPSEDVSPTEGKQRGKDGVVDSPGTPAADAKAGKDAVAPGFLAEWIQKTELGRDYYVKEAFSGWWFPFQIPAESVTVTERLFCNHIAPEDRNVADAEGTLTAFLVARKFGIVKEPQREFGLTESDDFDEIGSALARAMGLRKIEILVDRTPTLSNQPTPALAGDKPTVGNCVDAIKDGKDAVFAAGGSGANAGREIYWPRIAVPAAPDSGGSRQLVPYRFPVRLTFIDGRVVETQFPMLFCFDIRLGSQLYGSAPDFLRKLPVNAKVPLAPGQSASAFNPPDMSAEDSRHLLEQAQASGLVDENLVKMLQEAGSIPRVPADDTLTARDNLRITQLAKTLTAAFGGVREGLLEHVSSFRADASLWLLQAGNTAGAPEKSYTEWIEKILKVPTTTKITGKADKIIFGVDTGFFRCDTPQKLRDLASQVVRTVAWGHDAHLGVDAARAARRLAAIVDWIKGLDEGSKPTRDEAAAAWISYFKTLRGATIPGVPAGALQNIVNAAKEIASKATLDALEEDLPKIQIAWATQLGRLWSRVSWDDWFAGLVHATDAAIHPRSTPDGDLAALIKLEGEVAREPWRTALLGMIQKQHSRLLMEGTSSLPAGNCPWLHGEEDAKYVNRLFSPMALVKKPEGNDRHFAVPQELKEQVRSTVDALEETLALAIDTGVTEGQEALRRLWRSLEAGLPSEILLRQRIQQLSEDLTFARDRGEGTVRDLKRQLGSVLGDCTLHLSHLAAHADNGISSVRDFFEHASEHAESKMLGGLKGIEDAAASWFSTRYRKPPPPKGQPTAKELIKIEDLCKATAFTPEQQRAAENLKYLLQSEPAQVFQHFKNLLHETGGRHAGEIENKLLVLVDLVGSVAANASQLVEEANDYKNRVTGSGEALPMGMAISRAATAREEILAEARKIISPLRRVIQNVLGTIKADGWKDFIGSPAAGDPWELVFQRDLATRMDDPWISERLASRILDQLAFIRPADGTLNDLQKEVAIQQATIQATLAKRWRAGKSEVQEAINILKRQKNRFEASARQQIEDIARAVDAECKLNIWERQDAVELLLISAAVRGRSHFTNFLRFTLKKIGATDIGGGISAAEDTLRKGWEELRPELDKIRKTLGQDIGNLDDAFKNRLNAAGIFDNAQKAWTDFNTLKNTVGKDIASRGDLLEGSALQLVRKAELALAAPSLLKSFRDQSAKAVFQVDEMLISMNKGGEEAARTLGNAVDDVRKAVGFPRIEDIKLKIPDMDGQQVVTMAENYVKNGLNTLFEMKDGKMAMLQEAPGTFANLVTAKGKSLLQESGMAEVAAKVDGLSRDFGSISKAAEAQIHKATQMAETFKRDVEDAKKTVEDAKKAFEGGIGELKKKAEEFLPQNMGKLFGVLPFKDILAVIGSPDKAPQLLSNRLPDRIERSYSWSTVLKEFKLPGGLLGFDPVKSATGVPSRLRIDNKTVIWVPKPGQAPRQPDFSVSGQVDAFSLTLAGMMRLHFRGVSFSSRNGSFDFNPKLGRDGSAPAAPAAANAPPAAAPADSDSFMSFMGPLEAVDSIRQKLAAFMSGKNGPIISVEDQRIYAGYSFEIPAITCGALTIANIRLSAALSLPLKSGALTFRFQISERMVPFRVAVGVFTGGGYLGVQVSPDRRLCWVEGAAEFGGSLTLNASVAKGELFLMAGIYFRMEQAGVTFSGYVRAGGVITVLGLLEISILFYLALYYQKKDGQTVFRGECTVAVRVSLGFFKKTARVQMEKEFQGDKSSSDQDKGEVTLLQPRSPARLRNPDRAIAGLSSLPGLLTGMPLLLSAEVTNGKPGNTDKSKAAPKSADPPPTRRATSFTALFPARKDWQTYLDLTSSSKIF